MLCISCEKPLVAIGYARKNGALHLDWASRLYHKNCLKDLEPCKVYFIVSFHAKDTAKALGAKYDPQNRAWYAPNTLVCSNLEELFQREMKI